MPPERPGRASPTGRLLIVVVDKVTLHDLLAEEVRAPVLRRLAQEGAPGMMCVRAARGFGGEYATLGAGSRAGSKLDPVTRTSAEANAFQATERVGGVDAARAFRARTGWATDGNAIVHLGIGELLQQNEDASYPLQLGLLGAALRRAGIRVAVVGNADTAGGLQAEACATRHREAVAIAMDERGLVPMGDVSGDLLVSDPTSPYGVTADAAKVVAAFRRLSAEADLIVLDTGETARVEASADSMTSTALQAARRRAIEKTDRLLSRMIPSLAVWQAEACATLPGRRWSVLVVTPSVRAPERNEAFAALAPVIWWSEATGEEAKRRKANLDSSNPRISPSRLLTSPSTRRPGLVVNTDVAPSVLAYFGLPVPKQMVGRPFELADTQGAALERLQTDLARHDAVEAVRPQLFRALPILGAIALWLSALLLLTGERLPGGLRATARGLLLLALSAPAAMLLVALRALEPTPMLIAVAALSLAIAVLSGWLTRWRSGHLAACLLLVAPLVYDIMRGQQLLYWSPLSYSPAAGARFYGIGNEYGGALLAAAIILAAAILPRGERGGRGVREPRGADAGLTKPAPNCARALLGALVLALAAVAGLPGYGANLGISLAFGLGAALFCLYLWRGRVGWQGAVGAVVAAVALVAAAAGLDYLRHGPESSHIGRWIASLRQEGWQAASSVIERKLSMNLMLVRLSLWTHVAVAALGVLGVAVVARPARLLAALRERAWLTPAVISSVAGAAAAFALNDSGIVAAAIALLYAAGSLAYVALEEPSGRG